MDETWTKLNEINITEFYEQTKPDVLVWRCKINHVDCMQSWSIRQTYLGFCLEFDPQKRQRSKVVTRKLLEERIKLFGQDSTNIFNTKML